MRNTMILFLLQALLPIATISAILSLHSSPALAQTKDQNNYISAIDSDLSIKTILVAPFSDNIKGIYSAPLQQMAIESFESRYQWETKTLPNTVTNADSLTERPADVAKILQTNSGQALVTGRITKGPNGVSYRVTLFIGKEGHPFAIEDETNLQSLETERLKENFSGSLKKLVSKIPYQGMVMSRRGLDVTINLGRLHGIKADTDLQVIQVLNAKRHPKLKTVIATDKEILGKIKITKVDEAMSFGQITLEREINLIKPQMKIQTSDFISYPTPIAGTDAKTSDAIANRPDKDMAMGKNPDEWVPQHRPQYGKVTLSASWLQYAQSLSLATSGGVTASNSLAPMLAASGELWLTQEWTLGGATSQSVFNVDNPVPGSGPAKLSIQSSAYDFFANYNFNLSEDFFGPQLLVGSGISSTEMAADSSSPVALTSMKYGGLYLKVGGSIPFSELLHSRLEAQLKIYLTTSLSESSATSGSASNIKINEFLLRYSQAWRQNLNWFTGLEFNTYSSDFGGAGSRGTNNATGISHKLTKINFGVEYLF